MLDVEIIAAIDVRVAACREQARRERNILATRVLQLSAQVEQLEARIVPLPAVTPEELIAMTCTQGDGATGGGLPAGGGVEPFVDVPMHEMSKYHHVKPAKATLADFWEPPDEPENKTKIE